MRYLVTGGSGFIGSNIVHELVRQGHEVVTTGKRSEQEISSNIKLVEGDLTTIDWSSLGRFDAVFHQAAITDTLVHDRERMLAVNVESSKKLFTAVAQQGCKHIVYASSTAVYGAEPAPYIEGVTGSKPLNVYGESKKLLDDFALQFGTEHPDVVIIGLRYCNVFGPGESHKGKMATLIYQLAKQMFASNPRVFEFGEQKRDYIYVKDVVAANLLASNAKKSCIINCGGGKAISFNEVIRVLNKILGLNKKTEYIKNPYAEQYQSYTECDMTLAKKMIGFVPAWKFENAVKDYFNSGRLVSFEVLQKAGKE